MCVCVFVAGSMLCTGCLDTHREKFFRVRGTGSFQVDPFRILKGRAPEFARGESRVCVLNFNCFEKGRKFYVSFKFLWREASV